MRSNRNVEDREAVGPLREPSAMGEGIRDAVLFPVVTSWLKSTMRRWTGCRLVPVRHLLDNDDAPWCGIRCRGSGPVGTHRALRWFGFRPGRREQFPTTTRPGWERSAVKHSVPGAQQPEGSTPTAEPCPTGEGPTSNPDRRTGPRTKDLNTPPVRSALPAESNLKSAPAAFPSGLARGERINPQGQARATGTVPPRFLWRETSEKPDNTAIVSRPRTARIAPARVNAQIVHSG